MTDAELEVLAELVASKITVPSIPVPLVGVSEVAAYLGVENSYVYEHAAELGARRLGNGARPRLRFSLAEIDERLTAGTTSRGSRQAKSAPGVQKPRARRSRSGTGVALLPVRGEKSLNDGERDAA